MIETSVSVGHGACWKSCSQLLLGILISGSFCWTVGLYVATLQKSRLNPATVILCICPLKILVCVHKETSRRVFIIAHEAISLAKLVTI